MSGEVITMKIKILTPSKEQLERFEKEKIITDSKSKYPKGTYKIIKVQKPITDKEMKKMEKLLIG